MKPTKEIDAFLEEYRFTLSDKEKGDFANKGFNVWGFGKDEEFSQRLVNLILKGRKRATSSLYFKRNKISDVGTYGVIVDHRNGPRCLIRYTGYEIMPFSQVNAAFAEEEGEASGDLEEWTSEHRRFFTKVSSHFSEASLVLCEKFKLVYKSA